MTVFFTYVGFVVCSAFVAIVVFLAIPQTIWCFMGHHKSTGGYEVGDTSHGTVKMWTHCRHCGKHYLANERWMYIRIK